MYPRTTEEKEAEMARCVMCMERKKWKFDTWAVDENPRSWCKPLYHGKSIQWMMDNAPEVWRKYTADDWMVHWQQHDGITRRGELTPNHSEFCECNPKCAINPFFEKKMDNLWVTVCPPESVDERVFIRKIQKMVKSSYLESVFYGFEWRWNGSANEGIHCHLWIKGDRRRVKYHVRRTCKPWIIDTKRPKPEWEAEKMDYLQGLTWDDEKSHKKLVKDIKRRKDLNIENVYFKNYLTFK